MPRSPPARVLGALPPAYRRRRTALGVLPRRSDGALAELPALGRPLSLSLAYSLAVTVLLAEHDDPRHPRAAARWAATDA